MTAEGALSPKELKERYRAVGLVRGATLYLSHPVALRFVDDSEQNGLAIAAIEFFRTDPTGLHVIPLTTADWTSLLDAPNAHTATASETRLLIKESFPDGATLAAF